MPGALARLLPSRQGCHVQRAQGKSTTRASAMSRPLATNVPCRMLLDGTWADIISGLAVATKSSSEKRETRAIHGTGRVARVGPTASLPHLECWRPSATLLTCTHIAASLSAVEGGGHSLRRLETYVPAHVRLLMGVRCEKRGVHVQPEPKAVIAWRIAALEG